MLHWLQSRLKFFLLHFKIMKVGFLGLVEMHLFFLSAPLVLNLKLNWEFWGTEVSNEPGSGLVKLSLFVDLRKERKSKVKLFYA